LYTKGVFKLELAYFHDINHSKIGKLHLKIEFTGETLDIKEEEDISEDEENIYLYKVLREV
jgi:hypothetical protein